MRVPVLGETELLVPLHEGVFEQPMWQTFLRRLCDSADADFAGLFLRSSDGRDLVSLIESAFPMPVQFEKLFAQACDNGPFRTRPMREGRVYSLDELVEAGGEAERAFRTNVLVPLDVTSMRAMRLREQSGLDAWLVLAGERYLGAEVGNLFSALTPHLRVALRVLATLERERTRSSLNADIFSRMNFGWISVDAHGGIVDLDEQAERLLQQSRIFRRGPYNRLTPSSPSVDRQLTDLLRKFAGNSRALPRAINLSQDPWLDILVSPLRVRALTGDTRAVGVIYFRGDRQSTANRCAQLCDVFNLTDSEARLAWAMTQGKSIVEAAESCGLTVETARNYSKKIYAKTGARGQVDLVRHILTGVLALA
ncbi:helix-turn-helix transcriptional regulator [Hyphomonas sp.]|jgi:DNA-binding CsgD family transcriptional regulator